MTGDDADDDMFRTLVRRRPLRPPLDALGADSISLILSPECVVRKAWLSHGKGEMCVVDRFPAISPQKRRAACARCGLVPCSSGSFNALHPGLASPVRAIGPK